jgi:hypothetical protein
MSDKALQDIAGALRSLGNADAVTPLGALENLAIVQRDNGEALSGAVSSVASEIGRLADAMQSIAEALQDRK